MLGSADLTFAVPYHGEQRYVHDMTSCIVYQKTPRSRQELDRAGEGKSSDGEAQLRMEKKSRQAEPQGGSGRAANRRPQVFAALCIPAQITTAFLRCRDAGVGKLQGKDGQESEMLRRYGGTSPGLCTSHCIISQRDSDPRRRLAAAAGGLRACLALTMCRDPSPRQLNPLDVAWQGNDGSDSGPGT